MANDYQKINTLFLRDENNIIIPDRFTASEFTYLVNNLWECTEKRWFYSHPVGLIKSR